jgi:hypothetical protein
LATDKNASNQVDSFIFKKGYIVISVPMQDTFPFEAMKETHEEHKTKIDIDELITGTTNITQRVKCEGLSLSFLAAGSDV